MKNRGFSLIEVCVAVALVGIMIGVGGPKMKRHLASAKDTKAIATLGIVRTASQLYYSETGLAPYKTGDNITDSLEKLKDYMDKKTYDNIKDGSIDIGGSKNNDGTILYGGKVPLSFESPSGSDESGDGVYIWLKPEDSRIYDLKGKKWSEY